MPQRAVPTVALNFFQRIFVEECFAAMELQWLPKENKCHTIVLCKVNVYTPCFPWANTIANTSNIALKCTLRHTLSAVALESFAVAPFESIMMSTVRENCILWNIL